MFTHVFRVASTAALASTALAQQFVMYSGGLSDGDDTVVERIDPIMNPGAISGHVHQVFGSNALLPAVTYNTLLTSSCTTVGAADGTGNDADHSIYWVPSLYMEAQNGSGYIRVPSGGHKLYYKDAGSNQDTKADPFEFPEGFRMVAGDFSMRAPASPVQRQNITQWICHSSGPSNQGTYGGFPTGVTDCDAYPGFNGALHFPHCWNGEPFNQSAPTAHMAYPTGDIQEGVCPESHPTRLPHIFMENEFNLHAVVDQVKPNTFVLSQGDPTGYGWHADFFNGWEKGAIPGLFASCPQGKYGNEDIGSCPTYKAGTMKNECRLRTSFPENVDNPGRYLPGCNPVTTSNPARHYAAAAIDVSTDSCAPAGSSGSSGGSSSSSGSSSGGSSTGGNTGGSTGSSTGSSTGGSTGGSSIGAGSSGGSRAGSGGSGGKGAESKTASASASVSAVTSVSIPAGTTSAVVSGSPASSGSASPTIVTTKHRKHHHHHHKHTSATEAPVYGATAVVQDIVYATKWVTLVAQ